MDQPDFFRVITFNLFDLRLQRFCSNISFFLSFINPVVFTFIIGKNEIHGSCIICIFVDFCRMFFKRVRNAANLTGYSLWFVKPGEQDNEKCHVVGQCQLTSLSVTFFQTATKTTIVRLVHIVVFEFHFSFVDCNISKHKKPLYLALLDKCCVTFRTADFNTAFAFWYTYFLFTSRTFVNVMCLSLCHYTFL